MDAVDSVVSEARVRFERATAWEGEAQRAWREDWEFANGDSENNYQWPPGVLTNRDIDARPVLTINKTRQHNLQIINEAKRTLPSIQFKPVAGQASKDAAEVLEGLIRHIQYRSKAMLVYGTAITHQVSAGLGYWRVRTDWAGDDSFDQIAYLDGIDDPCEVLMDPEAKPDGSDANYCFISTTISKEEFEFQYPDEKELALRAGIDNGADDWIGAGKVKRMEYYRRKEIRDELVAWPNEEGIWQTGKRSDLPKDEWKRVTKIPQARRRDITRHEVEWFLIFGDKVLDRKIWPGKTIPVVPLPGEVTKINGRLDRKGHTRYLKDAQRMYNYWTSAAVEHVALQGKTPWVATAEAIEGHEAMWETANTENYAVLVYNGFDGSDARPVPMPQRPPPPTMPDAYLKGMTVAQGEMMMASGQYQAEMGQQTPERSALAIERRQNQSDNATYQYLEALAIAIQRTGQILLEIIPQIYDTERVVKILGEDGKSYDVLIDPRAQKAYQELQQENAYNVRRALNPAIGEYEVQAEVGTNYSTQREEAFEAFKEIATQAPEIARVIMDILFDVAPFPRAKEAADRLRRMVPPQALGGAPAEEFQTLQQELEKLQGEALRLRNENSALRSRADKDANDSAIKAFDAETNRLKVVGPELTVGQLKAVVGELLKEMLPGAPSAVPSVAPGQGSLGLGIPPNAAPAAPTLGGPM